MTGSCTEPVTLTCTGASDGGARGSSQLHPMDLAPRHFHATNLFHLAAAAAAGVLIAKAAHFGLFGTASSDAGALASAASGVTGLGRTLAGVERLSALPLACDSRQDSDGAGETELTAEARISSEPRRAGAAGPRAKARRMELGSASGQTHGASAFRQPPGTRWVAPQLGNGGSFAVDGLARLTSTEPSGADAEDWLGEQLAILARAERSLLEDDPDATLQAFEDYRARFPQGLLDPQMANVRQRAEQRFGAYIFP
jgi:hypothetical protein